MAKKKKEMTGKHAAHASQQPTTSFWSKGSHRDDVESTPSEATDAFESASTTSTWSKQFWRKKDESAFTADAPSQGFHGYESAKTVHDYANGNDEALGAYKDKRTNRKRAKKRLAVAGGILGGLIVVAYLVGLVYFSNVFLPNTTIGGYDVSNEGKTAVAELLETASDDYRLTVKGEGLDFVLSSADADLSIDGDAAVTKAMGAVPAWQWPYQIFFSHDLSSAVEATYDENGLGAVVRAKVEAHNATATQPTNATIGYDASAAGFKVVAEKAGTMLDVDAVLDTVEQAALRMEPSVSITSKELQKPTITSDNPKLGTAATAANKYLGADLILMLSTTKVAEVDSALIAQWVTLDESLNPTLSHDAMNAWIEQLASDCDTVGSTRTYTQPDGTSVTVTGGSYGWSIDHDALNEAVTSGVSSATVATIDIPCSQTAEVYNGVGQRDFGTRYIDIDLTNQHAVFYDGSNVLWETDVITGKPDGEHNTPTGVWVVNSKSSPQKLVGQMTSSGSPEYISTVQYWMPFVANSIGMHDATWQPGFGGSMYASGYGSHGCVNLSYSAAAELYGTCSIGDVVITHY